MNGAHLKYSVRNRSKRYSACSGLMLALDLRSSGWRFAVKAESDGSSTMISPWPNRSGEVEDKVEVFEVHPRAVSPSTHRAGDLDVNPSKPALPVPLLLNSATSRSNFFSSAAALPTACSTRETFLFLPLERFSSPGWHSRPSR